MKDKPSRRALLALAVASVAAGHSPRAHAALDEVVTRTASDVAATRVEGQRLFVRTRADVKEFAGSDGKVFAATWRGYAPPDLRVLLATHYPAYAAALRARRPGGHNHLMLATPEFTIDVYSHSRMIIGKVWLTKKLPKGIRPDELR